MMSALATCSPALVGALVVITVFLTALVFTARTWVSVVSVEASAMPAGASAVPDSVSPVRTELPAVSVLIEPCAFSLISVALVETWSTPWMVIGAVST